MKEIKLAPSLLSADFANLERDIRKCEQGGAEILHIDVMDGHFVPNITIGVPVVAAIRKVSDLLLDAHLMICEPDRYINDFAEAGADMISVHYEVCNHLHRTLSSIKGLGKQAGIVLNPLTPIELIYDAVEYCDFVLLMSVNPGFGGQSFINSFHNKCYKLKSFLVDNNLEHIDIQVDGGIKIDNVREVVASGANVIVSGSGIFSGDVVENLKQMRKKATSVL
ncbi:MAG: ribulose-phosphate 3-epimerase [Ignavibacteriae bacterium HGW-Ignavibacteriae-1]|jgi:ribulose-phosphate 3-epimerase|nr:MAG: ribulose-phosphate 3-epimerase [Ignavibacteriae bacterium HGW-Ignavibacteriae-1]